MITKEKLLLFILKLFAALFSLAIIVALVFLSLIYFLIPSEKVIRGCMTTEMYHVELCPGSDNYVSLNRISRYLQGAVISSEDSLFYQHEGFDWASLQKSFEENFEKGQFKRGGSTITQQLAKNMFLSKDKTLTRKLREALITWKIEKTLSKNEILEKYLNIIEYGQGIYGIKQAASYYFKKIPSEIDVSEAAFLAMLLPSPKKYSSSFKKKDLTPFARKRISAIVYNMKSSGKISEAEYLGSLYKLEDFFGVRPVPPEQQEDFDFSKPEPEVDPEPRSIENFGEVTDSAVTTQEESM